MCTGGRYNPRVYPPVLSPLELNITRIKQKALGSKHPLPTTSHPLHWYPPRARTRMILQLKFIQGNLLIANVSV